MLKKISASILLVFCLLLSAGAVTAQQDPSYGYEETRKRAGYAQGDVYVIINAVISAGLSMVGIAFLAISIYAGIRWMTARGKEELAEKAKHALEAGIIGLVVVSLAYAISRYVLGKLMKVP